MKEIIINQKKDEKQILLLEDGNVERRIRNKDYLWKTGKAQNQRWVYHKLAAWFQENGCAAKKTS